MNNESNLIITRAELSESEKFLTEYNMIKRFPYFLLFEKGSVKQFTDPLTF